MPSNRKLGSQFETELCGLLAANGYWTHNFAQNQAGQPADIIAVKNKRAWLIDCKVCTSGTFPLSRIEDNQHTAMGLWEQCGNDEGWFALKLRGTIRMFPYGVMKRLAHLGKTILSADDIQKHSIPLERWMGK